MVNVYRDEHVSSPTRRIQTRLIAQIAAEFDLIVRGLIPD